MVGCTTLKFAKIAPEQPIDYVNDTTSGPLCDD